MTEATTEKKKRAPKAEKTPAKKVAAKKAPAKKAEKAPKKEKAAPAPRTAGGVDLRALRKALTAKGVEFEKKAGVTVLVELAEKNGVEVVRIGGNIIGATYRERYGKEQNNGDDFAVAFDKYVKVEVPGGKDGKGKKKRVLDLARLKEVAEANGLSLDRWSGAKNLGHVRMNLGNVLRGMNRKGTKIVIGTKTIKGQQPAAA